MNIFIEVLLTIVTGGVISALFFKFYSSFDRYKFRNEREYILPSLIGGFVSILLTLGIQYGLSQIYEIASIMYSGHTRSIYFSPLIEEIAKGSATLVAIRLMKSEELLDSLFIALGVGLGFAFFENLLYSSINMGGEQMLRSMIERTIIIAPMHSIQNLLFILLFLFIGRVVSNKFLVFLLAAPFPAISHSVWNYIALETGANLINLTLMIIISRSIIYAIRIEKNNYIDKRLREILDEEEASIEFQVTEQNGSEHKKTVIHSLQSVSSVFLYNRFFELLGSKRIL
ncbi:MAG: PrsW family intramembrane metalloprotease [Ignavibacteriales bacterium]|nr:PrsW family intramembrane metalloprotease [Ignavibacteriales bacterium]